MLSCTLHVVLVCAVLTLAARLVPRIEAVIHAELVALDATPPSPASVQAAVKPPAPRPPIPPAKKPLELPRLIEAPHTVEQPARVEAPPPVTPEPPPRKLETATERPRPEIHRTETPQAAAAPEPAREAPVGGSAQGPTRPSAPLAAPSDSKSPDALPSGVSMLAAVERPSGGGPAGGTGRGSAAVASTSAGAGSGITRTAIPRGGYQVQPRYPASARRQGIQGTTLLRVFVASDGRVTDVGVERTAGHADLDEAAAEAVRRWRFDPARRGDEPVGMWVLLPVEFRLK